jgi:uncharacterized OB-fold protein
MRTTVIPRVTRETQEFWGHCRNGVLSVQRCSECDHWRFPPQPMCPECNSTSRSWVPVDGRGALYTYTVVTGPDAGWEPGLPGEHGHPFALAIVELDPGNPVRMVTDIDTDLLEQLEIGKPMRVVFERVNDEIHLPRFVPDTTGRDRPTRTTDDERTAARDHE